MSAIEVTKTPEIKRLDKRSKRVQTLLSLLNKYKARSCAYDQHVKALHAKWDALKKAEKEFIEATNKYPVEEEIMLGDSLVKVWWKPDGWHMSVKKIGH